jgi:hypothetical protein
MVLNSAFVNLLVHQDCVCWIMKCTVFFMLFLHLFFATNSLKDLKYVRERAWIYVGGFFLHVVFLNTLRLNLLLLISKIGSYDLIYLNALKIIIAEWHLVYATDF